MIVNGGVERGGGGHGIGARTAGAEVALDASTRRMLRAVRNLLLSTAWLRGRPAFLFRGRSGENVENASANYRATPLILLKDFRKVLPEPPGVWGVDSVERIDARPLHP